MLTLHHLRIGRSIYTVWLLEELGVDYELKEYLRNPETMRAQDDLKKIHPLGKSPVIEDDGLVLSESGAITAYLLEKYDTGHRLAPPRSDFAAWARFTQWLHYSEGSAFGPLMLKMLVLRSGQPNPVLDGFCDPEIALHLGHIQEQLGDHEFILGDALSGADFGISFIVNMSRMLGQLEPYPKLGAYLDRNQARPAFARARERAVE